MKVNSSVKHLQVDKANLNTVVVTSIAAFVLIFCLVGDKALLGTRSYQAKVIGKKEVAKKQLDADLKARDSLVASYQKFVGTPSNIIGGLPSGQGDRDGDNGKIVLDALPSKYDFPALTTSLEKMVGNTGVKIQSISGTDDELTQISNQASADPQYVEMPFVVAVQGNYQSVGSVLDVFDRSIRPIQVQSITLSGSSDQLDATIKAKTFYKPEKQLSVKTEVVK